MVFSSVISPLIPLFSVRRIISSTRMYAWRMNIKIIILSEPPSPPFFLRVKYALVCSMQSSKVHLEKHFRTNLISNCNKRRNVRYTERAKRWLCRECFFCMMGNISGSVRTAFYTKMFDSTAPSTHNSTDWHFPRVWFKCLSACGTGQFPNGGTAWGKGTPC